MIRVKIFGSLREKTRTKMLEIETAQTVSDLIETVLLQLKEEIAKNANSGNNVNVTLTVADIKQCVIFVNDTPADKLQLFKTSLNNGDVVSFLSPVCGG